MVRMQLTFAADNQYLDRIVCRATPEPTGSALPHIVHATNPLPALIDHLRKCNNGLVTLYRLTAC